MSSEVREHRLTRRASVLPFVLLVLMVAFAAVVALAGIADRERTKATPPAWETFGGGALVAFFVGIGVWGLVLRRRRNLIVRALPDGLHCLRGDGTRAVFEWERIERVFYSATRVRYSGIPLGTFAEFRIEAGSGEALTLGDWLTDFRVLSSRVFAETGARLMPRAIATFDRGERVSFGPLEVDRSGIRSRTRKLGWPDVREVEAGGGMVVVRATRRRDSIVVPVAKVPNLPVLRALVRAAGRPCSL